MENFCRRHGIKVLLWHRHPAGANKIQDISPKIEQSRKTNGNKLGNEILTMLLDSEADMDVNEIQRQVSQTERVAITRIRAALKDLEAQNSIEKKEGKSKKFVYRALKTETRGNGEREEKT